MKFFQNRIPLMDNLPPQIDEAWIRRYYARCGDCDTCLRAKAKQVAVPTSKAERIPITRPGQLVASDLITLDANDELSLEGHRYIVFFYCAFTRVLIAIPLKTRDELPKAIAMAIDRFKQFGHSIEALQSDNEYVSAEIEALQGVYGFRPRFSCPIESKFQNGLAEKNVQDLMNRLRSALANAHPSYPKKGWTYALEFAIKTRNITTVSSDKSASAYTAFTGTKLSFPDITVVGFGRLCKVLTKGNNEGALDPKTVTGWFIGPKLNSKNVCEFLTFDSGKPERVSSVIGRRSFWPLTDIGLASMTPEVPLDATIPLPLMPAILDENIAPINDQGRASTLIPEPILPDQGRASTLIPEPILPPASAQEFLSARSSRREIERARIANLKALRLEALAIAKARTADVVKEALEKKARNRANAIAAAQLLREERARTKALLQKRCEEKRIELSKIKLMPREDKIELAKAARKRSRSTEL